MSQIIANRYEILNTIGQGGMGDVFRGRDTQTGETVAIKLLKPDIVDSDPNLVERFTREGEALRRLNHPNIVNMLAAVEEDDLHYIVMQYVGGGSLRDLLDREPQLPVDRVLSIGIELADALTRAHHLKIIHRDLKPENVLLNDDGTPLLTDFGVARIGTRTRVTATGAVIGTYAYLSPEACMGEELDPRTDIWSFGVILYEMLAGRRPFVSDQATAILLQIINEPLPDLSGFRPDTPPALVELVTHMLHKDREERLPSVRLVGAALEAIMHGIDTPFPLTPSQILQKQVDRSRFATPTPTGQNAPDPEVTTSDVVIMPPTIPATPAAPGIAPKAVTRPAQSPERTGMRRWWPVLAGIGALAVIALVIAALLGAFGGKDETPPVQVAPVGPGEYMVLVAQLEPLRGVAERDISRFIVEDLTARLEKEIPFSNIRIRQYPAVITGPGTAQTVAETYAAAVMVWGNYTADEITLEVQIGTTTAFPMIAMDRADLDRVANVRVRLTDERRESVAVPVIGVLNVLQSADGNAYEVLRLLSMLDVLETVNAEIMGGGAASDIHRGITVYLDDTGQAVAYFDDALERAQSPLIYAYRATAYLRLGEIDRALRDIETAQRLGPPDWTTPLYLLATYTTAPDTLDDSIALFNRIIALRPEDWFAPNFRGALYYLLGEYERAWADLQLAISLGPTTNFPYLTSMSIALRQGRWADFQQLIDTFITEFHDPEYSEHMVQAIYGDQRFSVFGPIFGAAGNLLLGQYEAAIAAADETLAIDDTLGDMYMIKGLARCNLGDMAGAEQAYTDGIAVDPDHMTLYAMRAEVRRRQNDWIGAMEDVDTVADSLLGTAFKPLVDAGLAGNWTCETLFDYDYSQVDE